ncbi:MAG: PPC domain-containing protein [Anaerolineae bacterium]|nr:PPC domain-containing protein [Anaerolineae bacterium]
MRTSRFILIFAVLALLLALFGTAAAQEEEQLTIPILEDGEEVEGTFSDNVTAVLYSFIGSEGDEVTISAEALTDDLDMYMVLLGERGEIYTTDDDTNGLDPEIELELPQDGGYFIFLTRFGPWEEVENGDEDYRLELNGNNVPDGAEPDSITYYHGNVEDVGTLEAEITLQEPVYYYTFTGNEGDVVNIDVSSNDFDTALHLFATNGERITANDDSNGSTDSSIVRFELPDDGKYIFFVTSVFILDLEGAGENKVGTFELNFSSK